MVSKRKKIDENIGKSEDFNGNERVGGNVKKKGKKDKTVEFHVKEEQDNVHEILVSDLIMQESSGLNTATADPSNSMLDVKPSKSILSSTKRKANKKLSNSTDNSGKEKKIPSKSIDEDGEEFQPSDEDLARDDDDQLSGGSIDKDFKEEPFQEAKVEEWKKSKNSKKTNNSSVITSKRKDTSKTATTTGTSEGKNKGKKNSVKEEESEDEYNTASASEHMGKYLPSLPPLPSWPISIIKELKLDYSNENCKSVVTVELVPVSASAENSGSGSSVSKGKKRKSEAAKDPTEATAAVPFIESTATSSGFQEFQTVSNNMETSSLQCNPTNLPVAATDAMMTELDNKQNPIQSTSVNGSIRKTISLYETVNLKRPSDKSHRSVQVSNVGCPITALDWRCSPLSSDDDNQYLCVGCHSDSIAHSRQGEDYSAWLNLTPWDNYGGTGKILIYSYGKLTSISSNANKGNIHMVINHYNGSVLSLKWFPAVGSSSLPQATTKTTTTTIDPSKKTNNNSKSYDIFGILAVCFSDNKICLYVVPNANPKTELELNPVFEYSDSHIKATCVDWSVSGQYMAGGFSTGKVIIWRVNSIFNPEGPQDTVATAPLTHFKTYFNCGSYPRSISWCQTDDNYFIVGGDNQYLSLCEMISNTLIPRYQFLTGGEFTKRILWPWKNNGIMLGTSDGLLKFLDVGGSSTSCCMMRDRTHSIIDIDMNAANLLYVHSAGTVGRIKLKKKNGGFSKKTTNRSIYEQILRIGPDRANALTKIYTDIKINQASSKSTSDGGGRDLKLEFDEEYAATKIACNPNSAFSNYYVVGTASGLLILATFKD